MHRFYPPNIAQLSALATDPASGDPLRHGKLSRLLQKSPYASLWANTSPSFQKTACIYIYIYVFIYIYMCVCVNLASWLWASTLGSCSTRLELHVAVISTTPRVTKWTFSHWCRRRSRLAHGNAHGENLLPGL